MIKQNINIINFRILYKILEEIKDNLNFNINDFKNDNEFLKDIEKDTSILNNSTIIVNSISDNLLNNKNIDQRTVLVVDDLPIEFEKLKKK